MSWKTGLIMGLVLAVGVALQLLIWVYDWAPLVWRIILSGLTAIMMVVLLGWGTVHLIRQYHREQQQRYTFPTIPPDRIPPFSVDPQNMPFPPKPTPVPHVVNEETRVHQKYEWLQ